MTSAESFYVITMGVNEELVTDLLLYSFAYTSEYQLVPCLIL